MAVAVLVTGCAAEVPTQRLETDSEFPRIAAEEVFSTGYRSISEKYIDAVSVPHVALEGIRGLASIDPLVGVERVGSALVLMDGNRTVRRFVLPPDKDVEGWAAVTVDVIAVGRTRSRDLAAASREKIYEAVFDSALSDLDIFSRYAGADEAKANRARRDGFGGVGLSFRLEVGGAVVTDVMADSPAARAGVQAGDIIVSIEDTTVRGLDAKGVSDRLQGPVHSWTRLTVRRGATGRQAKLEVERAHIVPSTVFARYEDGVLVARVSSFNQNTALSLTSILEDASEEMGEDLRGVILDLRGNPGGLLKQAVQMADLFLAQGDIISTRGRHPDSLQYYAADSRDLAANLPMVVLVDGKSASAAEVVAAALQDRGRAVVVGTNSYGKGTVQTVIRMPNDGEMTLTWSRIVAPSGYTLHSLGVLPSVCTSGHEGSGSDMLPLGDRERVRTTDALATWAKVNLTATEQRHGLRAVCPAEKRTTDMELTVAHRLIDDHALFDSTLGLSAAATAARY